MRLLFLIILSAMLSYVSCGIINCKNVKRQKSFIGKAVAVFPKEKIVAIYCIVMFVALELIPILFYYVYDTSLFDAVKQICLASILFPMAYIDYKQYRIPNKLILLGLGYRVVILVFELILLDNYSIKQMLISEGIAILIIVIFIIVSVLFMKGGIGMGDLKFMLIMALFQGMNRLMISLGIVMIIAFFYALFLIVVKKKDKKDSFPFGPIIALGTLVSLICFDI